MCLKEHEYLAFFVCNNTINYFLFLFLLKNFELKKSIRKQTINAIKKKTISISIC